MNIIHCIVGPTASGKSAVALQVAAARGMALLSADARQIYRGMDIGTNKPTAAEQTLVPHLGLDLCTPDQRYSAAQYAAYGQTVLAAQRQVLACGGTGLYLKALDGWLDDMPEVPANVSAAVQAQAEQEGLAPLLAELAAHDPATYARIDRQNPARVVRAVAVWRATGQPISAFRTGQRQPRDFQLQYIGLDVARDILYQRIDQRVLTMVDQGLVAEVDRLLDEYGPDAPSLQTIGYSEIVAWRRGELSDLAAAIARIQQHTRNYAKRQWTWFRRQADVTWLPPEAAADYILAALAG